MSICINKLDWFNKRQLQVKPHEKIYVTVRVTVEPDVISIPAATLVF